ncbi:hypothetical protein UFOVP298_46 [uncultured Caudovirales phage]|uniref:Uncharacterized protein n=1 Tax=uncultured Caudovirales phage TaxID=2100421 RepID=A0A6J5MWZ4_9CAUD|nr:hypothetical protein UFOVP298_46 [uncultured Caudovirales phage]CAB4150852.1 hypothetical protein UFOVP572_45 [uncultured Caudovirales phage]
MHAISMARGRQCGKRTGSSASNGTSTQQAARMAKVCFRVFMLEGALCDISVQVAVFFVKLCAGLGKRLLILGGLLFPMACFKAVFGVFKRRFVRG